MVFFQQYNAIIYRGEPVSGNEATNQGHRLTVAYFFSYIVPLYEGDNHLIPRDDMVAELLSMRCD